MLSKAHRFSFKKGAPRRIFSSPMFVIRYDTNVNKGLHAAVVVGKKVDKKAVVRNKIKRKTLLILQELVLTESNFDIVLFAKKPIGLNSNEEIRGELQLALKKSKIII